MARWKGKRVCGYCVAAGVDPPRVIGDRGGGQMCDECRHAVQKFNAVFEGLSEPAPRSPREYQNPMRRPPRKKMHTGVGWR